MREIRRLAGETQQQLLATRAALEDQVGRLDAALREQATTRARVEERLGKLSVQRIVLGPPATVRRAAPAQAPASFDYEDAVGALVAAGLDEETVRWGSIPAESLTQICETIGRELAPDRPAIALHVGNFLGVSLAAVASALHAVHPQSLAIAVDPGVTMGGIPHPQDHVIELLERYGLTRSVLLVCGYSFARTDPDSADAAKSDGRAPPAGTPLDAKAGPPPSCEDVLPLLARLGVRYDLAVLDGHHGQDTVAAELRYLSGTLRDGGLVFLDDADDAWPGIRDLFRDPGERFHQEQHDGRVGVLRRVS